ncbi:hypothetical protein EDB92DRAFT_1952324 [Lactarius akahatsu]|uniref:DRBM domain-containing protein n=1 Tax=Lactarius akahatsu TaxID=416441 RepID=A0AAD4Q6K3_9AGAM|nr:hypothetical protein EDB92DRAFT_1952324 [Lactarius akahatsu]
MRSGLRERFTQTTTHTQLHPYSSNHFYSIAMSDFVRDLNNFLQGHPSGNLTTQFSWEMKTDGPNHQITHHAVAKLRGVEIGRGKGVSMGLAKREAANIALQRLKTSSV